MTIGYETQSAAGGGGSQMTELDGFQYPGAFRAQLLQDMREMEAVKKKVGL